MTRLVLHAGTHCTDGPSFRQQLVAWREPLAQLGVRLHPSDDTDVWSSNLEDLSVGNPSDALTEAATSAVRDGSIMLLLSSDTLEDALREPVALAHLERFAVDAGMSLTVLAVIRDQLGYLNELYCERITRLKMARDFASFVADPQPAGRFDYGTAFDALFAASGIDFIAVPYAGLTDGAQARALLVAAGLDPAALTGLTLGSEPEPLPGPVLVAATRLLYKRMWRMGMFGSLPRGRLLEAARQLRQHGARQGWDQSQFWGWDEASAQQAIERFQTGNDAFATAAWGREWGDSWEHGGFVDVDFAASSPALVVDMMDTVDGLVKGLQKLKLAAAADVPPGTPDEADAKAGS